jgi:uroporphyrinogen decarboxylase
LATLFHLDPAGNHSLGQLGWCEAAFRPAFPEKLVEDRGDTEVVQDTAGRHVLFFKGRRMGFMPDYVGHPVRDMKSWEEDVRWRLNPASPERFADLEARMTAARQAAAKGLIITQNLVGGYMYLRSLIGPEPLLLAFYDMPELIHACMRQWLELADAVIARHQQYVTLDEIFLAEDICYNVGPLISPDMMREFLIPYYQQLIANLRPRQIDKSRHLYVQVDTDGNAVPVIPVYRECIGMDAMSPFEVASNCDVVAIGRQYPDLAMSGGIDKRVLARSTADIDRLLERILPVMRARGGYIPTCDHGVPPEVPWENYLHYRRRCVELGGE